MNTIWNSASYEQWLSGGLTVANKHAVDLKPIIMPEIIIMNLLNIIYTKLSIIHISKYYLDLFII